MVYIFGRNLEYYKMACDDKKHDATFIDLPRGISAHKAKKYIYSIYKKCKPSDIFVFYHTCFFIHKLGDDFGGNSFMRKMKKILPKIKNKKVLFFHDEEWIVKRMEPSKWKHIDKIATYDKNVAKKYGWPYIKYSIEDIRNTIIYDKKMPKYDISIIQSYGSFKNQGKLRSYSTYFFLKKLNAFKVNYLFGFRNKDSENKQYKNKQQLQYLIKCNNYSPKNHYEQEFTYKVASTKCCCFMAGGNSYITGKLQMAVLLNQKIITDLQEIKDTPFYDERWVKVVDFTNVSDKIIKWLKDDKIKPNYKHKEYCLGGEFAKEIKKLF